MYIQLEKKKQEKFYNLNLKLSEIAFELGRGITTKEYISYSIADQQYKDKNIDIRINKSYPIWRTRCYFKDILVYEYIYKKYDDVEAKVEFYKSGIWEKYLVVLIKRIREAK